MQNGSADAVRDITILYEDDAVCVIDKPSGIIVHDDGHFKGPTVVEWFVSRVPEASGVGEVQLLKDGSSVDRSGVVHRIDTDTSGVLILAKTQAAHAHVKQQFHDRLVQKEYRAFVYGTMAEQWGTIDRPIGRSSTDFRKRSAERGSKGVRRQAVTDWERLAQNQSYAYLRLMPKTGRTHQLRVHLKSIGRPIVGDVLYAPQHLRISGDLRIGRLALHAHVLTLMLPNGERKTVTAPLPASFTEAAAQLGA